MTKLLSILNILFIPIYVFFLWFFVSSLNRGFLGELYLILIICNVTLCVLNKDISKKIPVQYLILKNAVISLSVISSIYFILWLYSALNYLTSTLQ